MVQYLLIFLVIVLRPGCVLAQIKKNTKIKLPQILIRKEVIVVEISQIGQNMPIPGMSGMGPPSASNIASRVIDELDTNEDGVVSEDELIKAGKLALKILDADADGDGCITKDELISKISEEMENMEGFPGLPEGERPDINQLISIMAQVGTEQSEQSGQSGLDILKQVLSQLNLSAEETEAILAIVQNSGISFTA